MWQKVPSWRAVQSGHPIRSPNPVVQYLSDPCKPGVRSLGPDARKSVRPTPMCRLNWCDSGWRGYQLRTNWQCQWGKRRQCSHASITGGLLWQQCKWCSWWPNFEPMQVARYQVAKFATSSSGPKSDWLLMQVAPSAFAINAILLPYLIPVYGVNFWVRYASGNV